MDYNVRQQNVIKAKDKEILCLAGPGSGKTASLVGRINYLIEQGANPKNMVCFSFTNQAAKEMRKRLSQKGKNMFIGTIHSYANKICNLAGVSTQKDITEQRYDKIIEKAIKINISYYPAVDYLFVDEFQDTDKLQYAFIQKIPAINRFFVGDEKQFIYGFRGATDEFVRQLYTDDNCKKYFLIDDYRNPPNILSFAESFLHSTEKLSPNSISTSKKDGYLDECSFKDAVEEMTWSGKWVDWAILCRTNEDTIAAQEYLNDLEIPSIIIKRGDLDLDQMEDLLKKNCVKIFTVHGSKGLEFPHVITVGCHIFNDEERRICYVAATRAVNSLYWCPSLKKGKRSRNVVRPKSSTNKVNTGKNSVKNIKF